MSVICPHCSPHIIRAVPKNDDRERLICTKCDTIYYENPKIVAGILPVCDNKILLCKRNIEPRKHYWTIPSGFMELNETLKEAALREAKEEAGISPMIDHLHTIYDLPDLGQVYFLFKGICETLDHTPGDETMASMWVTYDAIPWSELAFSSVTFALTRFFEPGPHYGSFYTP